MQETIVKVPKAYLDVLNQIFEIEKKVDSLSESNSISRNINKLKDLFESEVFKSQDSENQGFIYHNPLGETYNETRIDCEASIAGNSTENLIITEVIKPIIRYRKGGQNTIVQKAVVIAETKN